MNKITLPDWVGDDWEAPDGMEEDFETMIIVTQKKINEIVDWINAQ